MSGVCVVYVLCMCWWCVRGVCECLLGLCEMGVCVWCMCGGGVLCLYVWVMCVGCESVRVV